MRSINLLGCRPFAGFALVCLACSLIAPPAKAAVFNQINAGVFVPTTFGVDFQGNPATFALSQNDTGATGGFLPNFSTIFDNFTFSGPELLVTNFSWIGGYEAASPLATTFTLNVFNNVNTAPLGDQPGSLLQTFSVGNASQTALGLNNLHSYSATVAPFSVAANQKYWFSVVADLNFTDNGWGVAFSNIGDDEAFQDFQGVTMGVPNPGLTRFKDPIDYAFSVTAVPEPSTWLLLASAGGFYALRRRRLSVK